MSKDTSLAVALPTEQLANLDRIASESNIVALQEQGVFAAAVGMANAIDSLKNAITKEVMEPIMKLQGSALGFRTDKDREGGYSIDVVKEAFIEATLRGFKPVGNQWNLIAGRFYATKEGFEARFREMSKQGLITDLKLMPSVPKIGGESAVVTYSASWKWRGNADSIEGLQIPIRVNKMMGDDAILGKATRKMLAAIYSRVTGTETSDADVDDGKSIAVEATTVKEVVRTKLPADVLGTLEELLAPHEAQANKFLLDAGCITKGQTFRDVSEKIARDTIKRPAAFFQAAGVKASE